MAFSGHTIISPDGKPPSAKEVERLSDLCERERFLYISGRLRIAGVDEAGRGPLAGPLVASAVVLQPGIMIKGIDDSKKLSARKRERIYPVILEHAVSVSTSIVDVTVLDELNVLGAAREAMKRALAGLHRIPDYALVDGLGFPGVEMPHEFITGGDGKCQAIAAASIIAKVTRDRIMNVLDREFPEYGFSHNKGYPTRSHRHALSRCGPTPVHRMSFPAVRRLVGESGRWAWGV